MESKGVEYVLSSIEEGKRVLDLDLSNAILSNKNLSGLQGDSLDFSFAQLINANLQDLRIGQSNFREANFKKADFSNSVLRMCIFDRGQGDEACFNNVRLEDSSAKGAYLEAIEMKNAKLTETSFERAVLKRAIFDQSEGDGIEFRGADLSEASLVNVTFNEADFRGADLRKANLSNGCFQYADFRGALLDATEFDGANFKGAIFDKNKGPLASEDKIKNEKSNPNDDFSAVLSALFSENIFGGKEGETENGAYAQELAQKLKEMSKTYSATATQSPEEWKAWAESFMRAGKSDDAQGLDSILELLYDGPIKFPEDSILGKVSKKEMMEHLSALNGNLHKMTSEPPEEWKPMLEKLMGQTENGQIDFKSIIEALSKPSK